MNDVTLCADPTLVYPQISSATINDRRIGASSPVSGTPNGNRNIFQNLSPSSDPTVRYRLLPALVDTKRRIFPV